MSLTTGFSKAMWVSGPVLGVCRRKGKSQNPTIALPVLQLRGLGSSLFFTVLLDQALKSVFLIWKIRKLDLLAPFHAYNMVTLLITGQHAPTNTNIP